MAFVVGGGNSFPFLLRPRSLRFTPARTVPSTKLGAGHLWHSSAIPTTPTPNSTQGHPFPALWLPENSLSLVFAGLVAGDSSTIMGDGNADLRRKARSGALVRTRSGRRDGLPFSRSVFGSMALCGVEECRGVSFISGVGSDSGQVFVQWLTGVGSSCCFWAVGVGSDRLFTMLYLSTGVGSGLLLEFSQCFVACFVGPRGRSLGLCLSSTPKGVFFIVPFGTFRSLTLLVSTQDNTRWALSHDGPTLGVYSITVSVVVFLTFTTFHHIV